MLPGRRAAARSRGIAADRSDRDSHASADNEAGTVERVEERPVQEQGVHQQVIHENGFRTARFRGPSRRRVVPSSRD